MATLTHLPNLQSLSANNFPSTPLPIFCNKLYCCSHQILPRISATITKKSRASTKVKSNEDLCKDIKEFLSMVGLPQDHVPSTKELSKHGRQDLANIVRRRGYKFIRELLATQIHQQGAKMKDLADNISLSSESTEVEGHTEGCVDDISLSGEAMKDEENMNDFPDDVPFSIEPTEVQRETEDSGKDMPQSSEAIEDEENINDLTVYISLSSEATEVEKQSEGPVEGISLSSEGTNDEGNIYDLTDDISSSNEATEVQREIEDSAEDASLSDKATKDEEVAIHLTKDVSPSCVGTISNDDLRNPEMTTELKPDALSYIGPHSSSNASLEEKVAKFVQDGELDNIQEGGFEILKRNLSVDSVEFTESADATESNSDSIHAAHEDLAFSGAGGSDLSNGHITFSSQPVENPARGTNASRGEIPSNEKVMVVDHNEGLDVEAQKADNQVEISRLRCILHQKELELTKLREQIEKEKLALFVLQSKAEKEINEAQKLMSEKDAELCAAEESLSGLKEVEIQYRGEGEIIEVAGSFNGWQQRIKMDPLPSSSISDLTGSWKSRLWRTVLWLYPGVYEIKFIVDGNWTIDPQKESVTRGSIPNNILRVD